MSTGVPLPTFFLNERVDKLDIGSDVWQAYSIPESRGDPGATLASWSELDEWTWSLGVGAVYVIKKIADFGGLRPAGQDLFLTTDGHRVDF